MNQQERRTYSDLNKSQLNRFERNYLSRIYNSLHEQILGFTNILQERGTDAARRQLDRYLLNDSVGEVIDNLYTEAGLFFARKTYREIRRSIKQKAASFGFNQEWTDAIIKYLRRDQLESIASITQETKDQILTVLEKGVQEGWSISRMVDELKSPELIAWRARRIVRTELAKAGYAGRKAARETSDYETEKEWIAANDHRTRPSHRKVDGEIIDVDARFQVAKSKGGYEMMDGPGDPTASAENVIECRCTEATVAKRDERGNLIPKTKRVTIINPGLFNPKRTTITI